MSQLGKTMLRVALGALAMLMAPLVASQVVEGWNWNAGAFVFVYVLFFGTGMVYAVIAAREFGGIEVRGRLQSAAGSACARFGLVYLTAPLQANSAGRPALLLYR